MAYQNEQWVVTEIKKYNSGLGEWYTDPSKDFEILEFRS